MKLKKGDFVKFKNNYKPGSKLNFNNFGGRIERIHKNGVITVIWDSFTLNLFSDEDIKYFVENEYYLFDFNFSKDELIQIVPRDTIQDVYDAQEKLYDKKLQILKSEIPKTEEYYDRFRLSPYYTGLTNIQKDKSWSIIDIFSTIMIKKFDTLPDNLDIEEFKETYYGEFQDNVIASKNFKSSVEKVLIQFLKFMQNKMNCETEEIQSFLENK